MAKIRWGIVGAGRISNTFCKDLILSDNAEILAVAARDPDRAAAFATKHHIQHVYADYQQLFNDDRIDVVYIGTPHTFHFQHAKAAIVAGKHVLCEKPLTVSPEQCATLSALAKQQGVLLMEAMWTLFLPAINKVKAWLAQGKVGDIRYLKVDFGFPMPYSPDCREYNKELAGGCLYDMGIYPLALVWYLFEQDISAMQITAKLAPNGVEQNLTITGQLNQAEVTLTTSFQCQLPNSAYIAGDKGYIVVPQFFQADSCQLYQGEECVEQFDSKRSHQGYLYEIEEVNSLIVTGKTESLIASHEFSLKLQQQMAGIKSEIAGTSE